MPTKHDTLLRLKRLNDELTAFQALLRQDHPEDINKSLDHVIAEMRNCIDAYSHYERKNALLRDYNAKR